MDITIIHHCMQALLIGHCMVPFYGLTTEAPTSPSHRKVLCTLHSSRQHMHHISLHHWLHHPTANTTMQDKFGNAPNQVWKQWAVNYVKLPTHAHTRMCMLLYSKAHAGGPIYSSWFTKCWLVEWRVCGALIQLGCYQHRYERGYGALIQFGWHHHTCRCEWKLGSVVLQQLSTRTQVNVYKPHPNYDNHGVILLLVLLCELGMCSTKTYTDK